MPTTSRTPTERAYHDASNLRDDLETARASERRASLQEYTAALDHRLDEKYGEQIRAAKEEEARAHAALMQEREAEALARQYPYPLGTVMVEWEYPSHLYRATIPADRKFTGRKGVLEIITAASEHPGNRSCGLAGIGDLVIRILKKDGKPGREYVNQRWKMGHWVPEGTDLMQSDLSWPEVTQPEITHALTRGIGRVEL